MEHSLVLPSRNALLAEYEGFMKGRLRVTRDLEFSLERKFSGLSSNLTVKGRLKDFPSYHKKYIRILKNASPPVPPEITDLIGLRVVCPFLEDMVAAEKIIKENFEVVEAERKGAGYSFKEFGYESTHLLINIPPDILWKRGECGCKVAEIQIRTSLQDAWAEVEHELVYKAEFTPFDEPMKRKLAALNASLSLADTVFQEIRSYQRQLNGELGKRRDSFYQKIEDSTDALLFMDTESGEPSGGRVKPGGDGGRGFPVSRSGKAAGFPGGQGRPASAGTVDDLLLNALYAHNKKLFDEAIGFYSRILEMKIDDSIRSLIHKHRGMAYFAQSKYREAIGDFSSSLEWDKKSYKAAYYRGVVHAVQQLYSQAAEDFTLSLAINPYQSFCLFRRGQAHYHIGDYPQALADCDSSLALEPDNEGAKKLREILLDKLKM
ncbi:MAG: tetratricopeptide repeat protein [Treponema sp.]|jgi:putative GTP pyrophosphokinase|nr:tetratricopeptide repeat protein [Treponema sp.]